MKTIPMLYHEIDPCALVQAAAGGQKRDLYVNTQCVFPRETHQIFRYPETVPKSDTCRMDHHFTASVQQNVTQSFISLHQRTLIEHRTLFYCTFAAESNRQNTISLNPCS